MGPIVGGVKHATGAVNDHMVRTCMDDITVSERRRRRRCLPRRLPSPTSDTNSAAD